MHSLAGQFLYNQTNSNAVPAREGWQNSWKKNIIPKHPVFCPDSSLFVCSAIDLVWQVSNISNINCVCFLHPSQLWIACSCCLLLPPGIYWTIKLINCHQHSFSFFFFNYSAFQILEICCIYCPVRMTSPFITEIYSSQFLSSISTHVL